MPKLLFSFSVLKLEGMKDAAKEGMKEIMDKKEAQKLTDAGTLADYSAVDGRKKISRIHGEGTEMMGKMIPRKK